MSRIDQCFARLKEEGRAGLVSYIMGGDPDSEGSLEILKSLPEAGADIIELGIPFTDPTADGPTIQEAGQRALAAGTTVKKILEMVEEFRSGDADTPIILMGYYNPIYKYGIEAFVKDAVAAGVDGVIIVDLPPEEEGEFTAAAYPAGLALIKLTAPTTDDARAPVVLNDARGFVYYVSIAGITGTKTADPAAVKAEVDRLRNHTDLPIAVGFGIKTPEDAKAVAEFADAVVVGSALVNLIKGGKSPEGLVKEMATALK